jgi:hypothetical protein
MEISYRASVQTGTAVSGDCKSYAVGNAIYSRRAVLGLPAIDIAEGLIYRFGADAARSATPHSPQDCLSGVAAKGYTDVATAGMATGTPSAAVLDEAARHKLRWYPLTGSGVDEIRTALAKGHIPIVTMDLWFPDPGPTGIVHKPAPGTPLGVGHAMAICGISDSAGTITGPNIFGPYYGDGGFVHFTQDCFGPTARVAAVAAVSDLIEDGVTVSAPAQPQGATVTYDQIIAAIRAGTFTSAQIASLRAATDALTVTIVNPPSPPPAAPTTTPTEGPGPFTLASGTWELGAATGGLRKILHNGVTVGGAADRLGVVGGEIRAYVGTRAWKWDGSWMDA